MKVYLRSKGSINYGWGHVIRSFTLADFLKKSNTNIEILMGIEGDASIQQFAANQGLNFISFNLDFNDNSEQRALDNFKPDIIIFDILIAEKSLLNEYKQRCKKLILFNDLGINYDIPVVTIMPQLLDNYPKPHNHQIQLKGPDYFIFSKSIQEYAHKEKIIPNIAQNLLIIMGGSLSNSLYVILKEIILKVRNSFDQINLIIGYDHRFDKENDALSNIRNVNIIEGTKDLGSLMHKADLALASSGYVKYELAAMGVPSILTSIVDHQDNLGSMFSKSFNASIFKGNIYNMSTNILAKSLIKLSNSFQLRDKLSQNGKRKISTNGLLNIRNIILNQFSSDIGDLNDSLPT